MPDTQLLQMALIGYAAEREKIQSKIDEIRAQLGGRRGRPATTSDGTGPAKRTRRGMSAAARRRIAAAQKKLWAEYRKKQKAA
jgi:hypothetical protein